MLTIAIIGVGYWGPKLVKNFSAIPEISIKYICDLDKERIEKIISDYPNVEIATTDTNQIMSDDEVSAVVIATPVQTHYSLAKEALTAGKHVLVEKPITDDVAKAQEMVELAKQKKLILMVDHISVYIGAVQKIREIIQQGELGQILYFYSMRINLGKFHKDVNVVWDLVPHDLSILKYAIAKNPVAVSAVASSHLGNLEDMAYINILYEDKTLAHCNVSWLSPVKIRSLAIAGSKKMIVYNDLKKKEILRISDRIDESEEPTQYKLGEPYNLQPDTSEPLPKVCRAFLEAIQKNTSPITDGQYGLDIIKVIEAVQISIHKKGEPIPIQF